MQRCEQALAAATERLIPSTPAPPTNHLYIIHRKLVFSQAMRPSKKPGMPRKWPWVAAATAMPGA